MDISGGSRFSVLEQAVFSSGLLFSVKISAAQCTDMPRFSAEKGEYFKILFSDFLPPSSLEILMPNFGCSDSSKYDPVSAGLSECHIGQTDPQLIQPPIKSVSPR